MRNRTKRGGFHPSPPRARRIPGESTSASRRYSDKVDERVRAGNYVQLKPGLIVVWQHQPWRIFEIAERPLDLWNEEHEKLFAADVEAWQRSPRGEQPERATWYRRPITLQLTPTTDPKAKPIHLTTPASHHWPVLSEHYSVCIACGELPPCRHEIAEAEADQRIAEADVLMSIPPGHCLGCGEAITSRMQATRFPGPNLWRPDLPDNSAVFHARNECANAVDRYRKQWETRHGQEADLQLPFGDA